MHRSIRTITKIDQKEIEIFPLALTKSMLVRIERAAEAREISTNQHILGGAMDVVESYENSGLWRNSTTGEVRYIEDYYTSDGKDHRPTVEMEFRAEGFVRMPEGPFFHEFKSPDPAKILGPSKIRLLSAYTREVLAQPAKTVETETLNNGCEMVNLCIEKKQAREIEDAGHKLRLSTDEVWDQIVTLGLQTLVLASAKGTHYLPLVLDEAVELRLENAARIELQDPREFIISTIEADLERVESEDTIIHPIDGRWYNRSNAYGPREVDGEQFTENENRLLDEGFVPLNALRPERVAMLLTLPTSKEEVEVAA